MMNRNFDEEVNQALKNSDEALRSLCKENLYVPNSYTVSMYSDEEVYPVNLICTHHDFIEQIQIPNDDYLRINMKGYGWIKLYLPSSKALKEEFQV